MFSRKNDVHRGSINDHMRIPLFFKMWFIFLLSIILIIFGTVGYAFYSVASDPDTTAREVGRIIGEVSTGYNETANR